VTEVPFTVNGTAVTLDVEPRLTLADALRQRLGLTGTHLGCEHGVCGACTVLIDGRAARSCLTLAVQARDAEITTVEALGTPDRLHPLQEAFRRHHGLQCGFCTPGFLMSAYELVGDAHRLDEDRVRAELSGVLCRCTGYRGVVEAVCEVAREHPDGVPGPLNLGAPLTLVHGPPGALGPPEAAPPEPEAPADDAVDPASFDLSSPRGEPNAEVDVATAIDNSPDEAWGLLRDLPGAARCLPGVELTDELGEDTWAGVASLHVGPLRFRFRGAARVLERDDDARRLRAVATGEDVSGGGVRAHLEFEARPAGEGAEIAARARLHLSGRAARFGRSFVGDVSRRLFDDFGRCVERTLAGEEPAEPRKLRGFALLWRSIIGRLSRR
jgi:aerobic-type carbon monoxide dehydrogenase small subunit (CoxS/CutS family)/carbon monoxide dehydrogenase subunit G